MMLEYSKKSGADGHQNKQQRETGKAAPNKNAIPFAKSMGHHNFGKSMGRENFGKSMHGPGPTLQAKMGTSTPLDKTVQAKMENSFGTSFSDVNVHKDSPEATNMGAQAFTQGTDVHFAPGQYNPGTSAGQELIGHELTHVVQQKQGRVKATAQAKGAPVNDDPALEKEADEMGRKAVQGENVTEQQNSESGNSKKKDPQPDHPYMKVLGWGRSKNWTIFGTQYSTRFIYSGSPSDWKRLLATLDSDAAVNKYLVPFFAALGCSSGSVRNFFGSNSDYLEGYEYKDATPSDTDILNLLKALYDTDSSTSSSVDLPNEFWLEGGSNVPRAYDTSFDGLASFISKYQTMLITEKSAGMENAQGEATEGQALNYSDVRKLAQEGTRWSDPQINNPRVVQAMIDNAFATAVTAAKLIVQPSEGEINPSNKNQALEMVRNSAIIINATIDAYGTIISSRNSNLTSIFNQVWDIVPLPSGVNQILGDQLKNVFGTLLKNSFQLKSEYSDQKSLKGDFEEKFRNIVSQIPDKINSDLQVIYLQILINSFTSSLR